MQIRDNSMMLSAPAIEDSSVIENRIVASIESIKFIRLICQTDRCAAMVVLDPQSENSQVIPGSCPVCNHAWDDGRAGFEQVEPSLRQFWRDLKSLIGQKDPPVRVEIEMDAP